MATPKKPILIIGAGSWGTALATSLANNGQHVLLWDHDPKEMHEMQTSRRNKFFPDYTLPPHIEICLDLQKALKTVQDILLVVPSFTFRDTLQNIAPYVRKDVRLAWGTKGLDPASAECLDKVARNILGPRIPLAILSGPTFAREVIAGQPTAITLACSDAAFSADLRQRFQSPTFRVYTCTDLTGVQIAGAVKNVLAIAVGISDGLGFGANTRSALITRGLAEMTRLGLAHGAEQETFMGLAGIGDLVLTATDNQSRNRRCGLLLGQGKSIEQAAKEIGQVIEGVHNTEQVFQLAKRLKVAMPIVTEVYQILYHHRSPTEAVKTLLSREPAAE